MDSRVPWTNSALGLQPDAHYVHDGVQAEAGASFLGEHDLYLHMKDHHRGQVTFAAYSLGILGEDVILANSRHSVHCASRQPQEDVAGKSPPDHLDVLTPSMTSTLEEAVNTTANFGTTTLFNVAFTFTSPTPSTANDRTPCSYPSCSRTFKRCADMERHARKHEPTAQKYYCSVEGCKYGAANGKGFYRRDKLLSHVRNVHSE
ncbi:hypothetical protein MMC06_001664 [Schaereria dolodes]|nr:hypothetical protein [Schaereria dolodes]